MAAIYRIAWVTLPVEAVYDYVCSHEGMSRQNCRFYCKFYDRRYWFLWFLLRKSSNGFMSLAPTYSLFLHSAAYEMDSNKPGISGFGVFPRAFHGQAVKISWIGSSTDKILAKRAGNGWENGSPWNALVFTRKNARICSK